MNITEEGNMMPQQKNNMKKVKKVLYKILHWTIFLGIIAILIAVVVFFETFRFNF